MSFILIPKHGDDIQVNAWNWRPTLEFLRAENILDEETFELMGTNGCVGRADAELASRIAVAIGRKIQEMRTGERMRADLSITAEPKKVAHFERQETIDAIDLYSATYEWLIEFKDFCERSGGFEVS